MQPVGRLCPMGRQPLSEQTKRDNRASRANLQSTKRMPIIETINGIDRQLLTAINTDGLASSDVFWSLYTDKMTWIPLALVALWCLLRPGNTQHRVVMLFSLGLLVFLSDFVVSEFIKHAICRLRPSHDPAVMNLLTYVDDYRGGAYGFPSNHASNGFAIATFLTLVMRRPAVSIAAYLWACGSCYSRLYMGVHYPTDILCGALLGVLIALSVCWLYRRAVRRLLLPPGTRLYSGRAPLSIVIIWLLTVVVLMAVSLLIPRTV